MEAEQDRGRAVKTKAVVVEPASMTVVWMNESALRDFPDKDSTSVSEIPAEQSVPTSDPRELGAALRAAAETKSGRCGDAGVREFSHRVHRRVPSGCKSGCLE